MVAVIFAAVRGLQAAQPPFPYTAVEVDRFAADRGVAFPADYQSALAEDIAREISLALPTAMLLCEGDAATRGQAVLRIFGIVTRFKPGNRTKRYWIGFGAGATVVRAQVRFTDAATGQSFFNREVQGVTWTGVAGGDSKGAGDSLARKIAKFCNAQHLVGRDNDR